MIPLSKRRVMKSKVLVVLRMILDAPDFVVLEPPSLYDTNSYKAKVRSFSRNYFVNAEFSNPSSGLLKIFSKRLVHTFSFDLNDGIKTSYLSSRDYQDEIVDYMIELSKRRGD